MRAGNEAVVRRLIEEVLNRGQTGLLAELVAADHVGHDPFGDHYGPEGMRIAVTEYRAAFPDLRVTVEDLLTAGDKVAHRFTLRGTHSGSFLGIPPTGRVVTVTGIAIDRIAGGKVAESWISLDALHLLRQLGASPAWRRPADPMPLDTASPQATPATTLDRSETIP
jgi:steroid delta-isomerase-like uncharacterized protein